MSRVDVLALSGHSPGPWHVEAAGIDGYHLLSANGNWIATLHSGYSDHDENAGLPDTDERDEALIATAPELLAELVAARAAVAELVEAAAPFADAPNNSWRAERLRAALAKFGGAL